MLNICRLTDCDNAEISEADDDAEQGGAGYHIACNGDEDERQHIEQILMPAFFVLGLDFAQDVF